MFMDRFSSLDELKGRARSDPEKILAVLDKVGRFSCFEIDDRMAGAMTWLCHSSGWITCQHEEAVKDPDGHGSNTRSLYPWTRVTITDAGRAVITKGIR